jgi:hypothetical protein
LIEVDLLLVLAIAATRNKMAGMAQHMIRKGVQRVSIKSEAR